MFVAAIAILFVCLVGGGAYVSVRLTRAFLSVFERTDNDLGNGKTIQTMDAPPHGSALTTAGADSFPTRKDGRGAEQATGDRDRSAAFRLPIRDLPDEQSDPAAAQDAWSLLESAINTREGNAIARPFDFVSLVQSVREKFHLEAGGTGESDIAALEALDIAGETDATLALGMLFAYGSPETTDFTRALHLFEKAAEAGSVRAVTELGRLYLAGNGAPLDSDYARELFETAWSAGDLEGAYLLASGYRLKLYDGPEAGRVPELIEQTAALGHAPASCLAHDMFQSGELPDVDVADVETWLRRVADQGDTVAMWKLAAMLRERGELDGAIALYEKAVGAGSFGSIDPLMSLLARRDGFSPEKMAGYVELLRAYTENVADPPSEALLQLGAWEAASARDDRGLMRSEELLRRAAEADSYRAKLALKKMESGMSLREAVHDVLPMSDEAAYREHANRGLEDRFGSTSADRPMKILHTAQPIYPDELVAEKLAGWAVVEWVVTTRGTTAEIRVVAASHPAFGASATEALSRFTFEPAVKDGRRVNVRMRLRFSFRVE